MRAGGHWADTQWLNFNQIRPSVNLLKLNLSGSKTAMKSPKRPSMKASYEHKEPTDNDGPGFSPRSLFALPPDHSSLMLDSLKYADENSDQDLLLDVPSNNSFPQAELLLPTAQASTSSSSIYQNFVGP
ncbi:putative GATA transcription factor [Helianthus annuus]|nr:putative GATA transcription factor [Helianthus annuus]